jgi:flavin reductase (DIM6/NTAB) family NADH-FMN oxidoreductase RutF
MPISEEPPTIGVVVYKEVYTHECLEHHGEATINVPSVNDLDLTYRLGTVSGREVDKVRAFNVGLVPSEQVKVPGVESALAVYEVETLRAVDVGEVSLYVFRVLRAKVREGVADEWGLNFEKTNILLHGAGRVFHTVNPRKMFAKKA